MPGVGGGKSADLSVAHFSVNPDWPFRSGMAFVWAGYAPLRVFQTSAGPVFCSFSIK